MLTLGSKERFEQSRDVGCYLGLRPRPSQSGDRDPQLGITKAGNVVLDTGAADFAERTAAVARGVLSQGSVSAVSCLGVGSGSGRRSEEELQRLEVGIVSAFVRGYHDAGIAQFCLLSAVGSTARSRFRYVRVMGMKEDTVRNVGFARLAIFRPGIIVGNARTPAWVVWQYRSANYRSLNRRREGVAPSRGW